MKPRDRVRGAAGGPLRVISCALGMVLMLCAWPAGVDAQKNGQKGKTPGKGAKTSKGQAKKPKKPPKLEFGGMDLEGRLRTPQLLYFLERASAELEAASLEKRSFVPEMVRSLEEEEL